MTPAPSMIPALPQTCPRLRHIITGTFNTIFLHLLTFDTVTKELSISASVPAQGPHQYLTLGLIPNANERVVYATTWAEERRLSSWRVDLNNGGKISHINSKEITSTPSYVSVQPPPWNSLTSPAYGVRPNPEAAKRYLYQAGGPTGEVFVVDSASGEILEKEQEMVFLQGGRDELAQADKSRKALRYGAHNVDFDVNGLAYVAHLGRNSILVYSRDSQSGQLSPEPILEVVSPGSHDGPRHVIPSPNGQYIFSVTEHTSFVDAFRVITKPQLQVKHVQRVSILPDGDSPEDYRGDTLRLSPCGKYLFATTRGMHEGVRGWVKGWKMLKDVTDETETNTQEGDGAVLSDDASAIVTYRTPTSGGKANAFEWAPRYPFDDPQNHLQSSNDLAVLTDDQEGYVVVLEWDGKDLKEVARTQLPSTEEVKKQGASHAIWLS